MRVCSFRGKPIRKPLLSRAAHSPTARQSQLTRCTAIGIAGLLLYGFLPASGAQRLDGISFRLDRRNPMLVIPVLVNGQQYRFLLDTGSSLTAVDTSLRETVGQPLRVGNLTTLHGTASVRSFKAPTLAIAGRSIEGIFEVVCVDLSALREVCGVEVRGVLGMDFLRDQITRVDFDRGEIAFHHSLPGESGKKVPVIFSADGLPAVVVTLKGVGDRVFDVDTGDIGLSFGTIESRLLERLYSIGRAERVGSHLLTALATERSVRRDTARISEISLGEHTHIGAILAEGAENDLGVGYLLRYQVTFDFPGRAIHLRPNQSYGEPSRYDLSGARLLRIKEKTVVASVEHDSSAQRAGVVGRDVLVEIDGKDARLIPMYEIRRMLCIAGKRKLRLMREGRLIEVEVMLQKARPESNEGM